jgi:hypothetical protein
MLGTVAVQPLKSINSFPKKVSALIEQIGASTCISRRFLGLQPAQSAKAFRRVRDYLVAANVAAEPSGVLDCGCCFLKPLDALKYPCTPANQRSRLGLDFGVRAQRSMASGSDRQIGSVKHQTLIAHALDQFVHDTEQGRNRLGS